MISHYKIEKLGLQEGQLWQSSRDGIGFNLGLSYAQRSKLERAIINWYSFDRLVRVSGSFPRKSRFFRPKIFIKSPEWTTSAAFYETFFLVLTTF